LIQYSFSKINSKYSGKGQELFHGTIFLISEELQAAWLRLHFWTVDDDLSNKTFDDLNKNEDFVTNTCSSLHGCFVVVARIRVRTGKDDEPNHITLAGTLSYQEI
jgi:hypothetical protein